MQSQENPLEYSFNRNILPGNRIFGVGKRNLLEGIIVTLLADAVILQIPFVRDVKIVLLISISIILMIFNIRGIKNMAVTEIIVAEIRFQKNKRELHLRGPEYVREKKANYKGGYNDQSIAEQVVHAAKERIDRFLETNDKERNS